MLLSVAIQKRQTDTQQREREKNEMEKRFSILKRQTQWKFCWLFRYGKADDMNKINHDINFSYLVVDVSPYFFMFIYIFYDLWKVSFNCDLHCKFEAFKYFSLNCGASSCINLFNIISAMLNNIKNVSAHLFLSSREINHSQSARIIKTKR